MYKTFSVVFFLLASINSISQNSEITKFKFDSYDFPKAVIVNVESNDNSILKEKVEKWIENYFSKSTLIKNTFQNDSYVVEARANRFFKIKNLPTDLHYRLKISIRNNRYRFEVTSLSYKYYTELYSIGNVNLVKDKVIKDDLENSRDLLSSFFNNMNSELYNSIQENKDDW